MRHMAVKTLVPAALVCALATRVAAQTEPVGGQPPPGTHQSVNDLELQVAYQRAFDAVLWAMPALAIYRLEVGFLEQPGMAYNIIDAFSGPLRTTHEAITPNQTTPYIIGVSDLRNGPVVVEVPAKTDKTVLYGQVVDAWQVTIAEVGPVGADKGEGGKYLFVPPGYQEPPPSGYFVIRSSSYRIFFGFRSIQLADATAECFGLGKDGALAFDIVGQANHGVCAVATDPWAAYEHIERLDHICEIVLKSGMNKSLSAKRSVAA